MIDCSIIIPHYNQMVHLTQCLSHLLRQNANSLSIEIIIVDNGSKEIFPIPVDDRIRFIVLDGPKNPYECRNRGIIESKGQILCFLDAKCRPNEDWLAEGYKMMNNSRCDIVGGHFEIECAQALTSKIFPLMYLDNAKNVKYEYGLPSGNLFARKRLFQDLGLFDTKSKSGNDIAWTKKAIKAGYKVAYAPKSKVYYPGKSYRRLLKDILKYGRGAYLTGEKGWDALPSFMMPMKISTFLENSQKLEGQWSIVQKMAAWLLVWRAKIQFALGMISGIFEQRGDGSLSNS